MKPFLQEGIDLLLGRSGVGSDQILAHELDAQLEQFERVAELLGCCIRGLLHPTS